MEPSQETLQEILNTLKQIQETLDSNSSPGSNSYKVVLYLVPIFGIVFGSGFLFSIFYWWHKQRIEMIRSNIYKPIQYIAAVMLYSFSIVFSFLCAGIFVTPLTFQQIQEDIEEDKLATKRAEEQNFENKYLDEYEL